MLERHIIEEGTLILLANGSNAKVMRVSPFELEVEITTYKGGKEYRGKGVWGKAFVIRMLKEDRLLIV